MSITHIWDESMRVLPLTPEFEFEFQKIKAGYYEMSSPYGGIKYELPESGYAIKKYRGQRESVSIPAWVNGRPVVAIEENAFSYNAFIKEVEIPGSCRVIGKEAFKKNRELSVIYLPKGLLQIGTFAFEYCDLRAIAIPDSCHTIGFDAFAYNNNLSEVLFSPESLIRELDGDAFFLTNVHSITLPSACKCTKLKREGIFKYKYIEIKHY